MAFVTRIISIEYFNEFIKMIIMKDLDEKKVCFVKITFNFSLNTYFLAIYAEKVASVNL